MLKVLRNDEHEPLASFELEGGKVKATYVFPRIADEIEGDGLLYKGRVLRPRDGVDFMEALDATYNGASRWYIQTVDDDDE